MCGASRMTRRGRPPESAAAGPSIKADRPPNFSLGRRTPSPSQWIWPERNRPIPRPGAAGRCTRLRIALRRQQPVSRHGSAARCPDRTADPGAAADQRAHQQTWGGSGRGHPQDQSRRCTRKPSKPRAWKTRAGSPKPAALTRLVRRDRPIGCRPSLIWARSARWSSGPLPSRPLAR